MNLQLQYLEEELTRCFHQFMVFFLFSFISIELVPCKNHEFECLNWSIGYVIYLKSAIDDYLFKPSFELYLVNPMYCSSLWSDRSLHYQKHVVDGFHPMLSLFSFNFVRDQPVVESHLSRQLDFDFLLFQYFVDLLIISSVTQSIVCATTESGSD